MVPAILSPVHMVDQKGSARMAHDCPAGGDAHRRAAQPLLRGGCSTPTSRSGLQNALHRLGHAKRIKARIWGPWSSTGSTSRSFGRHGGIVSVRIGPHGIGASSPGAHADPGRTDAITDADYDGEQQRYAAETSARLPAPRRRACKAAGIRRWGNICGSAKGSTSGTCGRAGG